jgi:hypothetical protein
MDGTTIDFARSEHRDDWLHHPVYGDPSWDTFERRPGNPIWRGVDGLEWPVNGFLFEDPVSLGWFLYVGHYPAGYALGPGKRCICTVFRSGDRGASWEHLGPVFTDPGFCFEGDVEPAGAAPDVTVVYAGGRYHMAYDWVGSDATWKDARTRRTGVAYAWSEKPEGPYRRHPTPILRNDWPAREPILGKYNRLYGSTLVRRSRDWLLLTLMDSGPFFAWGLLGMTAAAPEGPYGDATPLFHVEGDRCQPPLMEHFPAFLHEGWIYAPSTSVALNRTFQVIQRAPVEEAMRPEAWEIAQHGSVWHGMNAEHESHGIWGQTLTGFVDGRGGFQVMYPSKDSKDRGTINLASRPWDSPFAARGFHLSAHRGPSLGILRAEYDSFRLEAELELSGAATLFWSHRAALRPSAPRSDASIHSASLPRGPGLRMDRDGWRVLAPDGSVAGSGPWPHGTPGSVAVHRGADGGVRVEAGGPAQGHALWEGSLGSGAGTLGVFLERMSAAHVTRFCVSGAVRPAVLSLLATEALLGAGQSLADWEERDGPSFRHASGAAARAGCARAKWSFHGDGFTLWSPRGPEWGEAEILIDGRLHERLDLHAPELRDSTPVSAASGLPPGLHAVVLRAAAGRLVVDSLDVTSPAPVL